MPAAGQRKVLFISYYFPPIASSGTYRNAGFVRELPEFGWEPIVLTVRDAKDPWALSRNVPVPDGVDVHRTPEIDLGWLPDKLVGLTNRIIKPFGKTLRFNPYRDVICMPDAQAGWRIARKVRELSEQADCIFVSCSPFSSGVALAKMRPSLDVPVVVDFRDPWMANKSVGQFGYRWTHRRRARLERFIFERADVVILNTADSKAVYDGLYPEFSSKTLTIENGFDQLNLPAPAERPDHFRIVHIGSFYGARKPTLLLEALAEARIEGAEFVQVGPFCEEVERFSDRVRVTQTGPVSREEALSYMRSAAVLYLKQRFNEPGKRYTAIAAKTFEYLATGVPILAELPAGDNAEIVARYAVRAAFINEHSVSQMIDALGELVTCWRESQPEVAQDFMEDCSRRAIAERLAARLHKLVEQQVEQPGFETVR